MNFPPLSEEEVLNLLPNGEYDFLVKAAEDKVSKAGNDMIKLTISIWDDKNIEHTIFDYLLTSMMYKVKHFADSVGLEAEYKAGGYTADHCVNKSGRCKVFIDNPEDSNFPPKNAIRDYIKGTVKIEPPKPHPDQNLFDSDIPF